RLVPDKENQQKDHHHAGDTTDQQSLLIHLNPRQEVDHPGGWRRFRIHKGVESPGHATKRQDGNSPAKVLAAPCALSLTLNDQFQTIANRKPPGSLPAGTHQPVRLSSSAWCPRIMSPAPRSAVPWLSSESHGSPFFRQGRRMRPRTLRTGGSRGKWCIA